MFFLNNVGAEAVAQLLEHSHHSYLANGLNIWYFLLLIFNLWANHLNIRYFFRLIFDLKDQTRPKPDSKWLEMA
jgi:hypothetical protein